MNYRHRFGSSVSLGTTLLIATIAVAQPQTTNHAQPTQDSPETHATQQPNRAHPAQDSPELYTSFFFFVEDFGKWTDARVAAADPSDKTRISNSRARLLGIPAGDFAQLQIISTQVAAQLRTASSDSQSYVESARRTGSVDRAVLANFHSRRGQIVQSGAEQLKTSLSPAGWQALHRYINNQHRQHVFASTPEVTASR